MDGCLENVSGQSCDILRSSFWLERTLCPLDFQATDSESKRRHVEELEVNMDVGCDDVRFGVFSGDEEMLESEFKGINGNRTYKINATSSILTIRKITEPLGKKCGADQGLWCERSLLFKNNIFNLWNALISLTFMETAIQLHTESTERKTKRSVAWNTGPPMKTSRTVGSKVCSIV